jgi:hypothetical protein
MQYSTLVEINESGFNKILNHFRLQRPSTFNYGTKFFHLNPSNFCEPDNDIKTIPYSTKLDEISFPGIQEKLQYCFQLRDVIFDFHPKSNSNTDIDVPNQSLQFYLRICLGTQFGNLEKFCSCFTVITNGKFSRTIENGIEYLTPVIDLITIPEIEPDSLRNIFEQIITQTINNKLFKEMKTSVESISFELGDSYDFELTLSADTPNPSISEDTFSIAMIIKN